MAFVTVYRRSNGEKVRIPERWVNHQKLGEPFSLTPVETETEKVVVETPARGKKEVKNA